jgi:hypothetical protein
MAGGQTEIPWSRTTTIPFGKQERNADIMFKTLRNGIASILKCRGLSIENRQGSRGGFADMYDAEIDANHQHWASDELRRAILGEGEKRPVPTAANVMQCPMREVGRKQQATGGVQEMQQYLQDGGIYREDN